jgi:type IV secretory pathway VirB9-like protein
MKWRSAFLASLLCCAAIPIVSAEAGDPTELHALPAIKKGAASTQIRVLAYSPNLRNDVTGVVGHPTTFCFAQGEKIYRVAQPMKPDANGGLTEAGWRAPEAKEIENTPLDNVVTLWPLHPGFSTMTIVTKTADGGQKPYAFRLKAINDADGSADDPNVTLNANFAGCTRSARPRSTSDEPETVAMAAPRKVRVSARKRRQQEEEAALADRYRTDEFNEDGGCHYVPKGQKDGPIKPLCPVDNKRFTMIRFPGLTQKPSVFVSDPAHLCGADKGMHERWPRQYEVADYVVVEETAQRFCLRLGNENVLQIDNLAWDPVGRPNDPTMHREILKAAK